MRSNMLNPFAPNTGGRKSTSTYLKTKENKHLLWVWTGVKEGNREIKEPQNPCRNPQRKNSQHNQLGDGVLSISPLPNVIVTS